MTPDREERIEAAIDELRTSVQRMHGALANLATLVAEHLQCHGRRDDTPAATASSIPPRAPQSSSVSLHAPAGIGIAVRGTLAATALKFLAVLLAALLIGAAGWAAHASTHAAQAAQGGTR